MNKINEHVYLGGFEDANVPSQELRDKGITAVLNCAFEIAIPYDPDVIKGVKVGLMDNLYNSPMMKRLAVDTLKTLLHNGETVLVHCAMGASRSAFVVTCALAEMEGKQYREKFEEVKKCRQIVLYGPLFANM